MAACQNCGGCAYESALMRASPPSNIAVPSQNSCLASFAPLWTVIATSPALTGKALGDDASFDSDDPTLSVVTGQSIEAVILYADDGTSTYLIMFQDTGVTGLPLTPDGSDVQVLVDATGWFVL